MKNVHQNRSRLVSTELSQNAVSSYEFGPYRLDKKRRKLVCNKELVDITPKALDTLIMLVQNSGKVLEKEILMKALWPDSFVEENNLSQNIFILRKLFARNQVHEEYIQTIPRRGYKFVAAVREMKTDPTGEMIGTGRDHHKRGHVSVSVCGLAAVCTMAAGLLLGIFVEGTYHITDHLQHRAASHSDIVSSSHNTWNSL